MGSSSLFASGMIVTFGSLDLGLQRVIDFDMSSIPSTRIIYLSLKIFLSYNRSTKKSRFWVGQATKAV